MMSLRNTLYGAAITLSLSSGLIGISASADELTDKLKHALPSQKDISFVQHESIQVPTRNALNEEKYMLLDFKLASNNLTKKQLQSSVHSICSAVLRDRDLLLALTSKGYDMVSVSFDRRTQYDCL